MLGCDQTLSLGDEVFHKPADREGARRHLLALSGKTHQLNSAAVLCRNGEVLWRHVGVASLTMRKLDPAFIGRHLARVGAKALSSVGAYQIEGEGVQLFDKIEGDYFTIVGLPLVPVLKELRALVAVAGAVFALWLVREDEIERDEPELIPALNAELEPVPA